MEPPGIGLQPKVDRSVDHAPAAPVSDYRISPIADRITAMQNELERQILADPAPGAFARFAVPQPVPQAPEKADYFDGINLETQPEDPVGDPHVNDASTDDIEGLLNEALASQATTRETDPATAALEDEFEGLLGR